MKKPTAQKLYATLAHNLDSTIRSQGRYPAQVARDASLHKSNVHYILEGRPCLLDKAHKLAKTLGVSLDALCDTPVPTSRKDTCGKVT